MTRDLRPVAQPLAYSIPDAAVAVGYSETVLKEVVRRGELVPRYANSKPVLLAEDLLAWLQSLPLEPPRRELE